MLVHGGGGRGRQREGLSDMRGAGLKLGEAENMQNKKEGKARGAGEQIRVWEAPWGARKEQNGAGE